MWKSYDALLFSVINVWTLYIFSFIFLRSNTILETNLYTLSTRSISSVYPIINLSITNELLMVQVISIFRAEKYYKIVEQVSLANDDHLPDTDRKMWSLIRKGFDVTTWFLTRYSAQWVKRKLFDCATIRKRVATSILDYQGFWRRHQINRFHALQPSIHWAIERIYDESLIRCVTLSKVTKLSEKLAFGPVMMTSYVTHHGSASYVL